MKKLILTVLVAGAAISTYAQGQLNFSSAIAPGTAIATNRTLSSGGLGPIYPRASGAVFLAQLYVGPASTADASLLATNSGLFPAPFATGAQAGFFAGGARTATGIAGGQVITAQIRAWNSLFASWEAAPDAERTPLTGAGAPNLIQVTLAIVPPGSPTSLTGINTYVIGGVPEPSSIALGLLGLGAVALFRRRK